MVSLCEFKEDAIMRSFYYSKENNTWSEEITIARDVIEWQKASKVIEYGTYIRYDGEFAGTIILEPEISQKSVIVNPEGGDFTDR